MKYIVLIGDGMSDYPLKQLGGKTPLQAARTPNLDYLAKNGLGGWVNNIPSGMSPGSDVAAMSIFGYDPQKYYTGRGPLEAASLGVKLKPNEVAFRCNLVTVRDGRMDDFTSGHITTPEARQIIKTLNQKIGNRHFRFYPGLSYRHLLVISGQGTVPCLPAGRNSEQLKCTPPHDITGKMVEDYLPKGPGAQILNYLMKESIMPLLEHPVNIKRMKQGHPPASMIWLWGQGGAPRLKSFKKQYGKSAAVITAVHLIKGLGKILGMEVINVPGATGFLDTNYKGKAQYALRALKRRDLVIVHVEAPDEAGHMGDVKGKIKAIEDFDAKVVGTILRKCRMPNAECRIMVLPDHPTPIAKMTHTAEPVPFVIYNGRAHGQTGSRANGFNEKEFKKVKLEIGDGYRLMGKFLREGKHEN